MAERISRVEYSEEMQRSYVNYSVSVVAAGAIPGTRDELKPAQRRVLYDMSELCLDYGKPHRKLARIVDDTMDKYHPHGDSSICETLVAMNQDFRKGMALVDGHGSFGSIEGSEATAIRYTKAHLERFAQGVCLKDLDKTANFVPNYDEAEEEPEILPVRVSNLLINEAEGIAVGMSASIPPHSPGEVMDVVRAYIDDPEISTEQLMEYIPGSDFPTGGITASKNKLPGIYENGMSKIKLRDRFEVELGKHRADKDKSVTTEIPHTVIGAGINKILMGITDLVESKKLTGMVDIPNQSNKDGVRIVLELRKDADIDKIRNILYKRTKLEDTFRISMLAAVGECPETLNLKGILRDFLNFQYENTKRKYNALLQKGPDKKEVQEGLITACDCIDLIITVLRGAKNPKDARACLMSGDMPKIQFKVPGFEEDTKQLHFTERQASAVLEIRLYKLIGLEILALEKEHRETLRKIAEYKRILGGRDETSRVIKDDLAAIRKKFSVPRRTLTENGPETFYDETAVAVQEVVFVLDRFGYCKLLDKSTYGRNQETVGTEQVHVVRRLNTDKICLFASGGNLYQIKAVDVSAGKLHDKGTPTGNLSKYDGTEDSIIYLANARDLKGCTLMFATKMAIVKQMPAEEFEANNHMVAATRLQKGDGAVTIIPVKGQSEVVLQTTGGIFLRFPLEEVSVLKKASRGVRGIKLTKNEELENLYLIGEDPVIKYEGKEVHMNRLKITKRDGGDNKIHL